MEAFRRALTIFCGVGAVCVVTANAFGDEVRLPVVESREIVSDEGLGRVLLDFGDLSRIESKWVVSANLFVPISGGELTEDLDIQVSGVAAEWRGRDATWNYPWRNEGGDLETTSPWVAVEKGSRETGVALDVTDEVRAMVLGEKGSFGLALSTPGWKADGFTDRERARFSAMSGATLVVSTVNTGPKEAVQDVGIPK